MFCIEEKTMAQIQIKELEKAALYDLSNEESQALVGGAAAALFRAFTTVITNEESKKLVSDPNATGWDIIRSDALAIWDNRANIADDALVMAVGTLATGVPPQGAAIAAGLR